MLGKIVKGNNFSNILHYLESKDGSQFLGGNMQQETPLTLAQEFRALATINTRVKVPVSHFSLSIAPPEKLDDNTWKQIAQEFLEGMGYADSQYCIYRHTDREHDHIHIVTNRVRLTDHKVVKDSWDYYRIPAVIKKLEKKYDLTPSYHHQDWVKSPSTGEIRMEKRLDKPCSRRKLQRLLDEISTEVHTIPELLKELESKGVSVKLSLWQNGIGISYQLKDDKIPFKGSSLGKAYTFSGLQDCFGVSYNPQSDLEPVLERMTITHKIPVIKLNKTEKAVTTSQQLAQVQLVSHHLEYLFNQYQINQLDGERFTAKKEGDNLELWRNADPELLFKAEYNDKQQYWQPQTPIKINQTDWEVLEGFRQDPDQKTHLDRVLIPKRPEHQENPQEQVKLIRQSEELTL